MSSSILIVGTGALACLFAARFSAVEFPVTMLGTWLKGVAALRSAGITLVEADGNEHSYPVNVVTNPEDCQDIDHRIPIPGDLEESPARIRPKARQ